jgi:hypothetical protein
VEILREGQRETSMSRVAVAVGIVAVGIVGLLLFVEPPLDGLAGALPGEGKLCCDCDGPHCSSRSPCWPRTASTPEARGNALFTTSALPSVNSTCHALTGEAKRVVEDQ